MTRKLIGGEKAQSVRMTSSTRSFGGQLLRSGPIIIEDKLDSSYKKLKEGGLPPKEQQDLARNFFWYGKRSDFSRQLYGFFWRVTGVFRLLLPKHWRRTELPPSRKERIAALKAYELLSSKSGIIDGIAQCRLALCQIPSGDAKKLLLKSDTYLHESAQMRLADKLSKHDAREVWNEKAVHLGTMVWDVIKRKGELWRFIND
jgi:hypothetical protein